MRMRARQICFVVVALSGAAAPAQAQIFPNRYQAIPDPSAPKSIWLFDTTTASLSHCVANDASKQPECSPWAPTPAYTAMYRYDRENRKMVPLNDAAREADAKKQNSN